MGLFDDLGKEIRDRVIIKPIVQYLRNEAVKANAEKAAGNGGRGAFSANPAGPIIRDQLMFSSQYAQYGSTRSKPGASVDYVTLRRFSEQYDIARTVINRRKRQLSQLEWEITTKDPEAEGNPNTIKQIREIIDDIAGYRVRFREFLDQMVEDLLVLDALAIYKRPTLGGGLYSLEVIDASTIQLRVDSTGATPEPPEIAYKQVIRGTTMFEFTADEMYYEMMNARSSSPYGLSPLETLVLTVTAALKSDLYNLHLLTEGNIPEGLYSVPDTWNPDQVKEFQELWDAALAGDTRATSRLKFVPAGSYTQTMKPEDMRYKELQEWLMKKTCMLYEIQPQEIGFTDTVNKSTGEVQSDIGERDGLIPLVQFFQEIFADVIQVDLGFPDYKFVWKGVQKDDERETAEIDQIRVFSGVATIDEIRIEHDQEPLGIDKPFILGVPTFIDEDSMQRRADAAQALINMGSQPGEAGNDEATGSEAGSASTPTDQNGDGETGQGGDTQDIGTGVNKAKQRSAKQKAEMEKRGRQRDTVDTHVKLVTEMRAFRKYALARARLGKKMRYFESEVLPETATIEMNARLQRATGITEVRKIFDEFMQDYQINFLANVANLKRDLSKVQE